MISLGPGPWGIYVHVPWCRRRCPYCAFYVEVDRGPDHVAYTDAVLQELQARRRPFQALGAPSTLFFGGGTPSRLPADQVARIVQAASLAHGAEVSLEANPEDLDPGTLAALRDAGVTRLSVGMQTLDPDFARLLNRNSTVDQARDALARLRGAGFDSYSVDLIFALPGQTLQDLEQDLDRLLHTHPPHVALYGLTYEPGTPFERARDQGRMAETDPDLWREMYERIHERLGQAGLQRYEISNYARPGHESRHNRLYWADRPYLGLGPSAHGYDPDGRRAHNVADVQSWQADPISTARTETPDAWQAAADLLISGLRGRDGLDLDRLMRRTGLALPDRLLTDLERAGLVVRSASRLALSDDGVAIADAVAERLAGALQGAPGSTG